MPSTSRLSRPFRPRWVGSLCVLVLSAVACQDGSDADGRTSDVSSDILLSTERGTTGIPEPDDPNMTRGQAPPGLANPSREVPIAELGYTMGDTAAPVRVVEFSDFACGYCRNFHTETFPTLEEEFIATGKVQWKYVPMILGAFGPNADVAARAGECALAQGRFPGMRDLLFENQPTWKGSREALSIIQGYAEEIGLDVEEWRQCVNQNQPRDRIASGTRAAFRAGLRGTPTFYVLGYAPIPGALPLDVFRMVLDTVYVDATSGGSPDGDAGSGGDAGPG